MNRAALICCLIVAVVALVLAASTRTQNSELEADLTKVTRTLSMVEYRLAVAEQVAWADRGEKDEAKLSPDVGTIQFIGRFTIELEKAEFRPEGLLLSGFVGNPNSFGVSSLTVTVNGSVDPKMEECFTDGGLPGSDVRPDVWLCSSRGTRPEVRGQSTPIASLPSGGRRSFEMLVSGAKSSPKDYDHLSVEFSGERYSY